MGSKGEGHNMMRRCITSMPNMTQTGPNIVSKIMGLSAQLLDLNIVQGTLIMYGYLFITFWHCQRGHLERGDFSGHLINLV